jgi:hypothetical protein
MAMQPPTEQHHVGLKINIRPGQETSVEMHHMPMTPPINSQQPAQGMLPDPMGDGMKSAMDGVLPAIQNSGSETARNNPGKPAKAAAKQVKTTEPKPKVKVTGKLPKKSSEKDKSTKP